MNENIYMSVPSTSRDACPQQSAITLYGMHDADLAEVRGLPSNVASSISRAICCDVPAQSIGFFARWWQLETWLRQLVYIEFRARYGSGWLDHLAKSAPTRAARDEINRYMASPDASNTLAYLDVSDLFKLIGDADHWALFEPSLLPRVRWDGLAAELQDLRNRNAHCRRPHVDDLVRIEQALRDLEAGARIALEAHNQEWRFSPQSQDPIVEAWVRKRHPDAARLVDHCEESGQASLRLGWSRRPWSKHGDEDNISGEPGLFVHATISLGYGSISPRRLWRDFIERRRAISRALVYLVADSPWSAKFTFAAIDGAEVINDAIGIAYDSMLTARSSESLLGGEEYEAWRRENIELDARVHIDSALTQAYEDQPFEIFGASAGGGS